MSTQNDSLWHNLVERYHKYKAKLLWQINLFLLLSTVLVGGFLSAPFSRYNRFLPWFIFLYAPLFLIVFYFLRRNRIWWASVTQISLLWVLVTTITLLLGMRSPSLYSYLVVIMLAGLLIGRRAVIITALASFVTSGVILILHMDVLQMAAPLSDIPPLSAWIGSVIHLFLITIIIYLTTNRLDEILANHSVLKDELATKQERLSASAMQLEQTAAQLQREQEVRQQAEKALSAAEQRYQVLFDTAPVMYVILEYVDHEPLIANCNQMFLDSLGYERDEVVGRPLRYFYAEDSKERLQQYRNDPTLRLQREIVEEPRSLLAKDGNVIPTIFRLIYNDQEEQANTAQAMYVDITMYEQAQEQAQTYAQQLEIMYQANVELSQTLEIEAVLESLLTNLKRLVPYDSAHVMLVDPEFSTSELGLTNYEAWTSPDRGKIQFYRPDSNPILQRIYDGLQTVIVDDTLAEPAWEWLPGSEEIRNWMGVPLVVQNELIGLFGTNKHEAHFFTPEHARLAESLAAQAAVSIANAILFYQVKTHADELESKVAQRTADLTAANQQLRAEIEERERMESALRSRNRQLAVLRQVGLQLAAQLELDQLLDFVLEQAIKLLNAEAGHLALLREKDDQEYLEIAFGRGQTRLEPGTQIREQMGVLGHIWKHRESFYVNKYKEWSQKGVKEPIYSSVIGAPVIWREQMVGVLSVMSTPPDYFNDDSAELLTLFAAQAAVAIKNAQLHEQVQQNAISLEKTVELRTRELTEANKQLRQLDSLRAKLIQDISHELRTPITNLSLYLELLERKPNRRERYLTILRQQMGRLEQLVQDIVQVSYIHARREQVAFDWIDVNQHVVEIANIHRVRAEAKELALIVETDETLPQLRADGKQLGDLINILLVNALAYTKMGRICLATHYDAERDEIRIVVSDTGPGVTEEDIPHIFKPFYRGYGASQSNIPGIGLGLTTAEEIARIHQGEIQVESQEGEGATFTVCLPRKPVHETLVVEGQ